MEDGSAATARKVMVVADGSRESTGALQYALSHAVMDNDTLILLHVDNAAAPKNAFGALFKNPISPAAARLGGVGSYSASSAERSVNGGGGGEVDFLDGMKRACAAAKPALNVAVEKVEVAEGKEKAAVIVAHSTASKTDLLIIGQKRNAFTKSILGSRRGLSFKGLSADTADYAIENSKCTCVAVQRKANGGYLLNSKTHKNFWLLA